MAVSAEESLDTDNDFEMDGATRAVIEADRKALVDAIEADELPGRLPQNVRPIPEDDEPEGRAPAERSASAPIERSQPAPEPAPVAVEPAPETKQLRDANRELRTNLERKAQESAWLRGQLEVQAAVRPQQQPPQEPQFQTAEEIARSAVERVETFKREQQAEREVTQFAGHVRGAVAQFAQSKPDYSQAFQHLVGSRRAELAAQGLNDAQVNQQLVMDEQAVAVTAVRGGKNPAAVIYALAEQRGYKPAGGSSMEPPRKGGVDLDTIARGQGAARSIGTAAGTAPRAGLSLQEIVALSDDEYAALPADHQLRAGLFHQS